MPVTCRRRSAGTGTTRPASRSRRNSGPALATTSRFHRRGPTTATTLVVPPSWLSRDSTARTPGNVARHTTTTVGRLAASPARCSGASEPRSTTVATSVPACSGQSTGALSLARRYKLISVRIPRSQPPVESVPSSTDAAATSPRSTRWRGFDQSARSVRLRQRVSDRQRHAGCAGAAVRGDYGDPRAIEAAGPPGGVAGLDRGVRSIRCLRTLGWRSVSPSGPRRSRSVDAREPGPDVGVSCPVASVSCCSRRTVEIDCRRATATSPVAGRDDSDILVGASLS
jgi:hypothetical protein